MPCGPRARLTAYVAYQSLAFAEKDVLLAALADAGYGVYFGETGRLFRRKPNAHFGAEQRDGPAAWVEALANGRWSM